jgi:hypothetical protein
MNTITVEYNLITEWDLDDYGIEPDEIEEYFVKYNVLHVKFKENGEWETFDAPDDLSEFDFKYHHGIEATFDLVK